MSDTLDVSEQFINDLMIKFSSVVDSATLATLKKHVCLTVNNYDITKKCTDIVVRDKQLPDCFKSFMVTKKIEGISDATLGLYKLYLTDMLYSLDKDLKDITANDLRVYLYRVQTERGISNRSLDSRRSVMSSFFGWISAEGYIPNNPMLTVKPIKYELKERQALKPFQLELVRQACTTDREKAMIEFLYSTACRVSELVILDLSDVDLRAGEVNLLGKGNKHRKSYLSPRAILYLQTYLKGRKDNIPALFVSERQPYKRLSKSGVERIIKEIGKKAGIDNLFPHLMRHTSATDLLARGMSVVEIKELLGHVSLDTSMIYAKIADDEVRTMHHKCIG